MRHTILSACVFALVLSSASAWWCMGHMLTARIAMKMISPSTLAKANTLVNMLDQWYPMTPDFMQAACWADDLKVMGVNQYDDWHFINLPYVNGAIDFQIDRVSTSNNILWAIGKIQQTLTSPVATELDMAIQLRLLIHFLGDLHQPLHLMTQFSSIFPSPGGDQGGNLYPIHGVNITILHAFFDSGAEQWYYTPTRPMSPSNTTIVHDIADNIIAEFPKTAFAGNLSVTDTRQWALDTYNAYASFVYSVPYNGTVTTSYETFAQRLCRSQVALGGYRLAAMLEAIFNPTNDYDAEGFPLPRYDFSKAMQEEEEKAWRSNTHLRGGNSHNNREQSPLLF